MRTQEGTETGAGRSTRRRPARPAERALPTALLVVALFVAGCSGSGSGAAPVTVTATTTIPTPITVTAAAPWTAATATTSRTTPTTGSWSAPSTRAGATTAQAPVARPPANRAPATRAPATTRAPAARPSTRATSAGGRSGVAGGVTVPNVVGDSLTAAFARLADLGVPRNRRSPHDVSGKGRTVLQPDNWQVCSQRPAAGTTATALTVYQFGVVKYGERCP